MRFFIALEIPEGCQNELEVVQDQLREIIPQVRLTDPNKLHLTIAFVGEQSDKIQPDLVRVIKNSTQNIPPFKITPANIDGFPNLHQANVFWVGVKGDTDKLAILRERIKDGLEKIGLDQDDRRYIPHIALAKINDNFQLREDQEKKLQEMMLTSFEPIQISSIKLFESIPEEGFHTHNTLAEVPL